MAAGVSLTSSPMRALHVAEQDADDLGDMLLDERVEDDDVVQPVQELRIEDLVHLVLDPLLHLLEARLARPGCGSRASCPA